MQLLTDAIRNGHGHQAGREHIVLLLDQFPAVLGGGERVVLRTARLLQRAGFRVSIVTFQILCKPEILRSAECPVYLLPLDSVFSRQALRGAWQLGTLLRRERVRVVMTFFESSNLFGGVAAKALSRTRLIWNRRDMGILRERKHWLAYRWLRSLPDHVIAVSEEVRRHAVEVDRIPAGRVSVVYNGVNRSADAGQQGASGGAPAIVAVGNIRHVKGQDTLVEAAALVLQRQPAVQFLVAGEPLEAEFYASLQRRVIELGIAGNVHFLGGVPEPGNLLRQAAIFALPSRSEGFSNAIVEAMASGLPVVATTVGGNAEAVADGVTGLLVPPEQPEQLAAALLRLLEDQDECLRMGQAGQTRAEELFSEAAMLRGLQAAFVKSSEKQG